MTSDQRCSIAQSLRRLIARIDRLHTQAMRVDSSDILSYHDGLRSDRGQSGDRQVSAARIHLTDAEFAVLELLWQRGRQNTRQLTAQLYPGQSVSDYATVQKLLDRRSTKNASPAIDAGAPRL